MHINVELHTALSSMRRAEIRQEVATERLARQVRTVEGQGAVQGPPAMWVPVLRLRDALAQVRSHVAAGLRAAYMLAG